MTWRSQGPQHLTQLLANLSEHDNEGRKWGRDFGLNTARYIEAECNSQRQCSEDTGTKRRAL